MAPTRSGKNLAYSSLIDADGPGVSATGDIRYTELSTAPLGREALAASLPRRGFRRRPVPWIAPELQMTPLDGDPRRHPPEAARADVIPEGLGVPVAPAGYRM
jgi:hypothetical protein